MLWEKKSFWVGGRKNLSNWEGGGIYIECDDTYGFQCTETSKP